MRNFKKEIIAKTQKINIIYNSDERPQAMTGHRRFAAEDNRRAEINKRCPKETMGAQGGDNGRQLEATEASSRAQIGAVTEPKSLTTPQGPLKLRLFGPHKKCYCNRVVYFRHVNIFGTY